MMLQFPLTALGAVHERWKRQAMVAAPVPLFSMGDAFLRYSSHWINPLSSEQTKA
jgi:hypothetical protein